MPKKQPAASRRRRSLPQCTKANSDPRWLYIHSVQCPEAEIDFVTRQFQRLRGRPLRRLREDFCGSAASACEFAKRHEGNLAVGFDLHGPTLRWGQKHILSQLKPEAQRRVKLYQRNVLHPGAAGEHQDAVLAMNFSYWIFHTRDSLREYFRRVRASLKNDGVFFLDIHGGYESTKEMSERRRIRPGGGRWFTYVWDQAAFDPVTFRTTCHIHFEFERGPAIRKAFTYHWRVWSTPEVRELLLEAGFRTTHVYLEGDDGKGGGDGIFRARTKGDADASFIGYIVAVK